jgi:hypothetical protein
MSPIRQWFNKYTISSALYNWIDEVYNIIDLIFYLSLYISFMLRILLWDCDNRSYSYYVETSIDQSNWSIVADKRNESCRLPSYK